MAARSEPAANPLVDEFQRLGARLRDEKAGWEVRFETPPGAYLHLSKPAWGDQHMDGVHFEAYGMERGELSEAVVALHCERGCPGGERKALMTALAERIRAEVETWARPDGANVAWGPVLPRGVEDCTVLESRVAFPACAGSDDAATVLEYLESGLARLKQELAPHVDAAIESVKR